MNTPSLVAAQTLHALYLNPCRFPDWVLVPTAWSSRHAFEQTVVYYDRADSLDEVKQLIREREPVNIAMSRYYNADGLEAAFGYREGAYARLSQQDKRCPNIAILCYATVKCPCDFKKVWVLNLIGVALDTSKQPDFQYFRKRPLADLVAAYRNMWTKALTAASDLKAAGHINSITLYNVGGGAFAGWIGSGAFVKRVFEPAFLPLLPAFAARGIEVRGYDTKKQVFTGGFVPDVVSAESASTTLFVNAWDPWSIIGNGNEFDKSLDGYWGRSSNMSVLGWSVTNPAIQYKAS